MVPPVDLLERESHLHQLDEILAASRAGAGRVVAIAGEAGSGKSSLVQALAQRVGGEIPVLVGYCDDLPSPHPLGPFLDFASRLGGEINHLLRRSDRRQEVATAMLDHLVASPPGVLVIEDAHWADDATLDLVRFLGRRIARTRVTLILTYRDDEVSASHPLQRLLGDLITGAGLIRIPVDRLSREAVNQLASGSILDRDALFHQTGGNPFFVTEILAAATIAIPSTVRDAVLTRASRISRQAREVLDVAAVAGNRVEPWLLRDLVPDAVSALEECLAIGLLQAVGDRVQFRHQLAEMAVREAISPLRLTEIHARVLAGLRSHIPTISDSSRFAHHAEAAGDAEAVLLFATEAGRRASEISAHREAESQFARALRFVGEGQDALREGLLTAWLPEAIVLGHLPGALSASSTLASLARARGDRRQEARVLSWEALVLVQSGRNDASQLRAREALAALDGLEPDAGHAFVYQNQAKLCMLNREYAAGIAWGERAMSLAATFGDTRVLVGALNAVGSCRLLIEGREAQGKADLEMGVVLARERGLDADTASLITNLGSGHGEIYAFDLAGQYLTEGISFAQERDLDASRWYQTSWLGLVRMFQGRWLEAEDLAQSVISAANAAPIGRIMALVTLGRVRARRGDPDVWPLLDEALALSIPTQALQRLAPVAAARAEAAWLEGDPHRAATEAATWYEMATMNQHRWHMGELAYWQWRGDALAEIPAGAARPYRLQMDGDHRAAADAWTTLGCPYEAARALAGSTHERDLREAFMGFDRLGAHPDARKVAAQLRARGVSSVPRGARPATRANAAGLTRREVEVLGLVASGLTNESIADRLFLSAKTIEHHASAIFAKLGVGTRQEATAVALRLDLVPRQSGG